MSLTIDGNSLVFDGTVTVTNAANPTTGICTLVLTPSGGVGNLPALVNGDPGYPSLFDSVTTETLSAGMQASVQLNQVSPGGPGEAAHYTLNFQIPEGPQGSPGVSGAIGSSSDLAGTAAMGSFITVSGVSPTKFQYSAFPWCQVLNPSSISNASASGLASSTLCAVNIPAQATAYYPLCFAKCTVNGTSNTVVNLTSYLNTVTSGNVLGQDTGIAGIPNQKLSFGPGFGSFIAGTGYGKVAANNAAVVYLAAQQTANTADAWSTSYASFTVVLLPVAS